MDIINNTSKLTGVPLKYIEKIYSIEQDYICYAIQQAFINKQNQIDIDIKIGTLSILIEEDKIYYKFIPSESLELDINTTILTKECPMIKKLETNIKEKVLNAYKDLL